MRCAVMVDGDNDDDDDYDGGGGDGNDVCAVCCVV